MELVNLEVGNKCPAEDVGEYHSVGQINVSLLRAEYSTGKTTTAINLKGVTNQIWTEKSSRL